MKRSYSSSQSLSAPMATMGYRSQRSIVNLHTTQTPYVPPSYGPGDCELEPDFINYSENRRLAECLAERDIYESSTKIMHRLKLMSRLNYEFNLWVQDLARRDPTIPNVFVPKVSGTIFTFGSFKLGVHTKGADIDTLCVGPKHVQREMFFNEFTKVLEKVHLVKNLRSVEDAFVPVVKFEYDGVDIDLIYARLNRFTVPKNFDITDNSIIKDIDLRCVRSLNGARVAMDLYSLVPNHDQFRQALRAVKLWAKQCGIYSNLLGYFGGITYAIMMARVNQLYPKFLAAQLVDKFFELYSNWEWPCPVMLKAIEDINYGHSIWNPSLKPADRFDLLPVITPSYPQQNSTHNVNESSKRIILEELRRGHELTKKILKQQASWDDLFDRPSFFSKFKNFVIILVEAASEKHLQLFDGLVASKLRFLVAYLDHSRKLQRAQIYERSIEPCKAFFDKDKAFFDKEKQVDTTSDVKVQETVQPLSPDDTKDDTLDIYEHLVEETDDVAKKDEDDVVAVISPVKKPKPFKRMWIVGIELNAVESEQKRSINISEEIKNFKGSVLRTKGYAEWGPDNCGIDCFAVKRKQLGNYVDEECLEDNGRKRRKVCEVSEEELKKELEYFMSVLVQVTHYFPELPVRKRRDNREDELPSKVRRMNCSEMCCVVDE
ncbi:hypothetical protein ACOME3_004928 [Neoechinorhynchus agilis]